MTRHGLRDRALGSSPLSSSARTGTGPQLRARTSGPLWERVCPERETTDDEPVEVLAEESTPAGADVSTSPTEVAPAPAEVLVDSADAETESVESAPHGVESVGGAPVATRPLPTRPAPTPPAPSSPALSSPVASAVAERAPLTIGPAASALVGSGPARKAPSHGEPVLDLPGDVTDDSWTLRSGTTLRRWQRDALEAWRNAQHIGIVQAVTGTGKTLVGVVAIAAALKAGMRCVVLVPTDQLVKQWTRVLHRFLPEAVVVQKGQEASIWDVRVSTVQTAMNRNFQSRREGAMLVADECHRYGAPGYARALQRGYVWRLGLSATAEREDDGDQILRSYFRGICFDVGYRRAVDDHLIAPYDIALVGVPLGAGERAEYEELTEDMSRQAMRLRDLAGVPAEPFSAFMSTVSDLANDWSSSWRGLARSYLAKFARRRDLLAVSQMKQQALGILTPVVDRSHGSLIFTQTKESAHQAATLLADAGVWAGEVHSGQGAEAREEKMFEFAAGGTKALAAPRVLDEGVDVPDADFGVVLASNRSRRQMIQRMGRVLRLKEDDRPARFVIMYAIDTVEDPHHLGKMPDFFHGCLPYARKWEEFDLSLPGESVRLLEFLGVDDATPSWETDREKLIGPSRRPPAEDEPAARQGVGSQNGPGQEPTTEESTTQAPTAQVTSTLPGADGRVAEDSPRPVGEHDGLTVAVEAAGKNRDRAGSPGRTGAEGDDGEELLGDVIVTDDIVHDYLLSIKRYPLLEGREEEVLLARRIECGIYAAHLLETGSWSAAASREELQLLADQGDAAFRRFVVSNLRLVVSVVKRFTDSRLELIERIQEGNAGLIRAVEKFDHTHGCKFSTYATWWIKQAATRAESDQGSTIRMPVHFVETVNKVRRWLGARDLSLSEGATAFPDGIPELEVSKEELIRISRLGRPLVSIDGLRDLVDDSIPMHPLNGSEPVVPGAGGDPNLEFAYKALAEFEDEDPRACRVLLMRWGLETREAETLDTIGNAIKLTRERIRQIEKAAILRLREILLERAKDQELAENRPRFYIDPFAVPRVKKRKVTPARSRRLCHR
ncbi:sigma-70 family RNA polymerase sigma factor [Acidipropionibacterium jensenii]|uniref:sigma-70 family RNA polymerase sigma factor n=1 Tax=Acidipropionibacterium jensenii TaxID=1749 RepID=UPI00264922AF|nr:sigma-70 family RNA polymerase sigma factor [Acidipropionibacterium jensenii]MDN6440927.1 sigma-70 family RNA polymerase sigma factor [Acidipropionibacterium jensenii]MDN6760924.1 sigma-70 family RNA polymerase sigma factor [Acidipropionibacterium jensenii]